VETLIENKHAIEKYTLAHDISEIADFQILKKEERANETKKINE
jgi:hypothetical protein